jgi:hypothetical protein
MYMALSHVRHDASIHNALLQGNGRSAATRASAQDAGAALTRNHPIFDIVLRGPRESRAGQVPSCL